MNILERRFGDVTVLELHGALFDGEDCISRSVVNLAQNGCRKAVLDFSDVPHINCFTLGEMVQALLTMIKAGGMLKLVSPTPDIEKPLCQSRVIAAFETFGTADQAAKSYSDLA